MIPRDRRYGFRVPVEMFLSQYDHDRLHRVMSENVSETGILVHSTLAPTDSDRPAFVGLEFELPGTDETIWAKGEICYATDESWSRITGIRFAGMAQRHARLLRDYCVEARRRHLGGLLKALRPTPA